MEEAKRERFLWGMLLAWIPWIPLFFALHEAFKGVSEQRATGAGAVLAGLQFFAIFGLVIAIVFGVSALCSWFEPYRVNAGFAPCSRFCLSVRAY
jgi:hypothetical protein